MITDAGSEWNVLSTCQMSLSLRQGLPRTHSSSEKQLLGQVEGRVYFCDVYNQCQ